MFKCYVCNRMEMFADDQHFQKCPTGYMSYVETQKDQILNRIADNIIQNTQAIQELTEVMRTKRW